MADIELVIKLDEELYNYMQTKEYDEHLDKRLDYQIRFAIKNGTPLPKGHGKLKDENDLWFEDIDDISCVTQRNVENAPTIIEADEVEE